MTRFQKPPRNDAGGPPAQFGRPDDSLPPSPDRERAAERILAKNPAGRLATAHVGMVGGSLPTPYSPRGCGAGRTTRSMMRSLWSTLPKAISTLRRRVSKAFHASVHFSAEVPQLTAHVVKPGVHIVDPGVHAGDQRNHQGGETHTCRQDGRDDADAGPDEPLRVGAHAGSVARATRGPENTRAGRGGRRQVELLDEGDEALVELAEGTSPTGISRSSGVPKCSSSAIRVASLSAPGSGAARADVLPLGLRAQSLELTVHGRQLRPQDTPSLRRRHPRQLAPLRHPPGPARPLDRRRSRCEHCRSATLDR